jgi:hypothetical protein
VINGSQYGGLCLCRGLDQGTLRIRGGFEKDAVGSHELLHLRISARIPDIAELLDLIRKKLQ